MPKPNQKDKKSPTIEGVLPLHQKEADLINLIRTKYKFGKIEIECKDGLPNYLLKTVEREKLG